MVRQWLVSGGSEFLRNSAKEPALTRSEDGVNRKLLSTTDVEPAGATFTVSSVRNVTVLADSLGDAEGGFVAATGGLSAVAHALDVMTKSTMPTVQRIPLMRSI